MILIIILYRLFTNLFWIFVKYETQTQLGRQEKISTDDHHHDDGHDQLDGGDHRESLNDRLLNKLLLYKLY